jgi:hypothetical protein
MILHFHSNFDCPLIIYQFFYLNLQVITKIFGFYIFKNIIIYIFQIKKKVKPLIIIYTFFGFFL